MFMKCQLEWNVLKKCLNKPKVMPHWWAIRLTGGHVIS